jgi:hypothetical protein
VIQAVGDGPVGVDHRTVEIEYDPADRATVEGGWPRHRVSGRARARTRSRVAWCRFKLKRPCSQSLQPAQVR